MPKPFKDFRLVAVLALAFIFQPFGYLTLGPTGAFDAQAQETRQKKEKPKGRRSQVLSKRAFANIEDAQNRLAETDYAGALSQLQQIRDGAKFSAYEKAVALQTEASSMPVRAIMPKPFRHLKKPRIPAICRHAW